MADALNVWMNGQLVGVWSQTRSKTAVLKYDPHWLASPKSRALSLSLPITAGAAALRGDKVQNYFDNLLPDSDAIRNRIRVRYGVHTSGAFELLTAIGRDCVGAVQLLPKDKIPLAGTRFKVSL
jgi:serine/threonine-protein kinase HipA